MSNLPSRELSEESKKDILNLPFCEVVGIRRLGVAFRNMLIVNYRRPFGRSNNNKKWEKVRDMPLKRFLRHGEEKMSIIIHAEKSPYWNKCKQKDMIYPLNPYDASYMRMTLKRIQIVCKELGFTEKDGPFMALDISKLHTHKV